MVSDNPKDSESVSRHSPTAPTNCASHEKEPEVTETDMRLTLTRRPYQNIL
jgi:hypothetical protein